MNCDVHCVQELQNFILWWLQNSLEALRCFGRQDAQQITPKIYFKIKIWFLAVSVNIK